jgi:hypothetical protein
MLSSLVAAHLAARPGIFAGGCTFIGRAAVRQAAGKYGTDPCGAATLAAPCCGPSGAVCLDVID